MADATRALRRLAVAQAVYKALGEQVATRSDHGARHDADEEAVRLARETGASAFDIRINGQRVGRLSVADEPARTEPHLVVVDEGAFERWALDSGVAYEERRVVFDRARALADAEANGELPGGCELRDVEVPARTSTRLTGCRPDVVAAALGPGLPDAVAGLLEGGEG